MPQIIQIKNLNIPDRGNFCICNRHFPSVRELYKEGVTATGTESEKMTRCFFPML